MAAANKEAQLLQLAVELMGSREPFAAALAVGNYLRIRLEPKFSELVDTTEQADSPEAVSVYRTEGDKHLFTINFSTPKRFVLSHCQAQALELSEIESLNQVILLARSRLEQMTELKGLTYTDDVTGLYNQRYLEVVLDREISLARRNKTPFVVLFLDLDHFKNVNDGHGHLIGSRLLSEVGQEVKRALRESDVTFRYGGDEFVMVLTQTNIQDALMVAERVRSQIEKKRFFARDNKDIRLTASIGVAAFPEHASTKEQILKAADAALYNSKKDHRNCVVLAMLGEAG
jgi:diguanylate cyclase (GGDEF)-like protein